MEKGQIVFEKIMNISPKINIQKTLEYKINTFFKKKFKF